MKPMLKTATYAVMHFVVAVGVAFALTRDWRIALGIGLIEPAVQTIAYAVHERIWERTSWRRSRGAAGQGGRVPESGEVFQGAG